MRKHFLGLLRAFAMVVVLAGATSCEKMNVKNGEPVASFNDFKDEMESKELKVDRDDYDYYIACYNKANGKG